MFSMRARNLSREFGNPANRYSVGADNFFAGLAAGMRKRGHRTDLKIGSAPYRYDGGEYVDIKFVPELDVPPAAHLTAFLAHELPSKEIVWANIERTANNCLRVGIQTKEERIPLRSSTSVPPGFVRIGTGLFRKSGGDDHRIWALEKDDSGAYALVRKETESVEPISVEVVDSRPKEAARLKVGAKVRTPEGTGHLVSYDRRGNPIVDLDGHRFVFRTAQVIPVHPGKDPGFPPDQSEEPRGYSQEKEESYLVDYYTQAFGDRAYAEALVKEEQGRKRAE